MGVGIAIGLCVVCCYCRKKKKRGDGGDVESTGGSDGEEVPKYETMISNGVTDVADSSMVKINMNGSSHLQHDSVVFSCGDGCNGYSRQSESSEIAVSDTGIMLYNLDGHGRECYCKSTQTDDGGVLQ